MVNSRDIDDLRKDVAVNCHTLIKLCAERGLPVLVTGTVRDAEYQKFCYMNGTAQTPEVGPHGFGLAFDICKNIKGHEYDDSDFFVNVALIGIDMGFIWGGNWKTFKDRPHFEWLGSPPVNRNQVAKGVFVSLMPEYKN